MRFLRSNNTIERGKTIALTQNYMTADFPGTLLKSGGMKLVLLHNFMCLTDNESNCGRRNTSVLAHNYLNSYIICIRV